ncbi:MAG: oxygenase MpaB family protein [Elainellaceae cyanobacterium]
MLFDRYYLSRQIQQLDPVQDNCQICHWLAGYEFPWDITRALEIALMRTFCVPSVAKLLDHTREFHDRTQKRYDDTGLLVAQIMKWGHSSPKGMAAIQRMNQIHGHFPIANADFLYVLSTFVYEPIRWIERFGWRPLSELEQQACFHFWRSVGEQMQIQQIPTSYAAFEELNLTYEQQYFRYSEANQRVGQSTLNLFLSWFPAFSRPALKPCIYALMDDRMLNAFGFPHPDPKIRRFVETALRVRGNALKLVPPRQTPDFYVDTPQRSYPNGFTLTDLGPPHMLAGLNRENSADGS